MHGWFILDTKFCPWGFIPCENTCLILVVWTGDCVIYYLITRYLVSPHIHMILIGDNITSYNYRWMGTKWKLQNISPWSQCIMFWVWNSFTMTPRIMNLCATFYYTIYPPNILYVWLASTFMVFIDSKIHQENVPWNEYQWRMCVYYSKLN